VTAKEFNHKIPISRQFDGQEQEHEEKEEGKNKENDEGFQVLNS